MPKVSVLMPIYNTNKSYLKESIESILNQTFRDFEFIIIDDCSNFDVESIIKAYNDPRIRFFKNDVNLGISRTRNKLMSLSNGEYLALMDDDDISLPERLEKQVDFLDKNQDISIVSTGIETFPEKQLRIQPQRVYLFDLLKSCAIANPAAMLRKADVLKFNLQYSNAFICSQDYEFWSRAIMYLKIANLEEVLLKYRINKNGITQTKKVLASEEDRIIKQNMLDCLTHDKNLQEHIKHLLGIDVIKQPKLKFLEHIFSIKNEHRHKVIRLFGVKVKFKRNINKKKPVLEYIETHITDHCNLNCKACNHFCPITNPEFCDVDTLAQDMKKLSEKFSVKKIRLLGGEPLLHKGIIQILKNTRTIFPDSDIRIVSNGTLIKSMEKDFFEACRAHKIIIDLSQYPAVKGFEEIIKTIKKNNVKVGFINKIQKFWVSLNIEGTSNIDTTFENCTIMRQCLTLYRGKLYKCPIGAYIFRYNKYFNETIPEEAGISISEKTSDEIMEYLKTSFQTCKYCIMPSSRWQTTEWAISQKDKKEWFVSI